MLKFFRKIIQFFTVKFKSPCCNEPMTTVLDMEMDSMVYTCEKCNKKWY